jgi:CubicO group peptidase (beta-lactamase class C family)
VTRFSPTFGILGKNGATLRQLLNHSAGLAPWKPFYVDILKAERAGRINFVASRAANHYVLEQIHHDKPASPPGAQAVYSDLGYMILGEIIETIAGSTLDRFCQDKIFKPLGLRSTAFVDLTQIRTKRLQPVAEMIAPTENCPWRKKILCGEVHDDNAYAMGGVVGHAGLFSCARDIHLLVARLSCCLHGEDTFWPQSLVEEFCKKDESVKASPYALGWDTPSATNSTSGKYFSPRSVGHLGFTGTSIWWDQQKDCHIILLSNRVHPTRKNEMIREFRPYVHDLVMQTLHP